MPDLVTLHQAIVSTDNVLGKTVTLLSGKCSDPFNYSLFGIGFGVDLSAISAEISTLQNQSDNIRLQLKNKKVIVQMAISLLFFPGHSTTPVTSSIRTTHHRAYSY